MGDYVYELTGVDEFSRSLLVTFFARLPDALRAEAHKLAEDLGRQKYAFRVGGRPGEYRYAMLLLALSKMRHAREGLSRKSAMTPAEIRHITELQVATVRQSKKVLKGRKQIDLDLRLYHKVKELRREGLSWRECALYLSKYNKLNITHVWLMKTYNKLSAERQKRGEGNGN